MSFDLITQALLTEAKILFMRQEWFIRLVESNEWRKELVSKIRNVSIWLIDLDIGLKTIKEVLLLENEEKLDKVSSVKMLFEQRFKNVPVTEKSLNDVIKFVESIL
jgi:oligoribonuclease NrnB/cAMP/cGMP phosphodiesterase (DHH superfamily)